MLGTNERPVRGDNRTGQKSYGAWGGWALAPDMTWGGVSAPTPVGRPAPLARSNRRRTFLTFRGRSLGQRKAIAATPLTSPAAAFSVAVAATGYFSYGSGVFSPGLDRSEAVIGGDAIATAASTALGIGLSGNRTYHLDLVNRVRAAFIKDGAQLLRPQCRIVLPASKPPADICPARR